MGKKARLKKIKQSEPADNRPHSHIAAIEAGKPAERIILIILLSSIIALGATLRVYNLGNVPARSPDEMVYTGQAKTVAIEGLKGIRGLVQEYNSTQELWKYPPPTRVGYISMLAVAMKLAGTYDPLAGAYLSCFLSIITLFLLIAVGLRFFNGWITAAALLFISVSPMSLAVARRSWQESVLSFMGLILIYLACEITRNCKNVIPVILFVVFGSLTMLIKSTGVVIYGLCGIWLLWVLFIRDRSFSGGFLLIVSGALGAGVSGLVLVHLVGGVPALKDALAHFNWGVTTSEYARDYASGPWYRFFDILWLLTPVNAVIFFVGVAGVLFFRKDKRLGELTSMLESGKGAALGIIFFIAGLMAVLFVTKEHPLNWRYVGALDGPFYILSATGLWIIALSLKAAVKGYGFAFVGSCIVAAAIFSAINDYRNFDKIIVSTGIKDLSIRLLKEAGASVR